MNRTILSLLAGAALAVAGCGRDNGGAVALKALCFPPTPDTTTGTCSYPATCTALWASGALGVDTAAAPSLVWPIQIDNERPSSADVGSNRTDTAYAVVDRFEIRYAAAGASPPSVSSAQTVYVPSAGSTVAVVAIIPDTSAIAGAVAGTTAMTAYVKAHGYYGDGSQFDTPEFPVPVTVSSGTFAGFACTAPKLPLSCPQAGQSAVATCNSGT
jgi:hypothetical protein